MLSKLSRFASALLLIVVLALMHQLEAAELKLGRDTMQTIKGKFEVTMQPKSDVDFNAGRMTLDKAYAGELTATGKGQMLNHITSTQGFAGYVAIQHVTGSLEDILGIFVLQHNGQISRGEQSLRVNFLCI